MYFVNHDLLLSKLSAEIVFSDVALEWFSTYLNNRSYFVKGVGCASHTADVKSGVPQGKHGSTVRFGKKVLNGALQFLQKSTVRLYGTHFLWRYGYGTLVRCLNVRTKRIDIIHYFTTVF